MTLATGGGAALALFSNVTDWRGHGIGQVVAYPLASGHILNPALVAAWMGGLVGCMDVLNALRTSPSRCWRSEGRDSWY
jgi:hypothetical protein